MMSNLEITNLKCIKLLDTLYELQHREWQLFDLPTPGHGHRVYLPDGREDIFSRLWGEITEDQYGNQRFTNDSFYRVSFERHTDNTLALEDKSDDMRQLAEYCKEAINSDSGGMAFILFEVSW